MTQTPTNPSLGEIWALIDSTSRTTREEVSTALRDIRERLDTFVTKEVWDAERRALERRLEHAEAELRKQDEQHQALKQRIESEAEEAASARSARRRDLAYKGILPAIAIIISVLALYLGTH